MATNSSDLGWREKKALIIGRASPEPSRKHIETVCTGGITEDGELLRLYPIALRYLEKEHRYRLWSWATFEVQKNAQDKRKESYKVREGSICILAHVQQWTERFSLLRKAIIQDRETLDRLYRQDWTSMGVVEIELIDFQKLTQRRNWDKDKPYVKQFNLYIEVKPLELLPIELQLRFKCKNNPDCRTHVSSLIGWEYGCGDDAFTHIKEAIAARFNDKNKRAYALLGTHHKYGSWMVAQLYFFDRDISPLLF